VTVLAAAFLTSGWLLGWLLAARPHPLPHARPSLPPDRTTRTTKPLPPRPTAPPAPAAVSSSDEPPRLPRSTGPEGSLPPDRSGPAAPLSHEPTPTTGLAVVPGSEGPQRTPGPTGPEGSLPPGVAGLATSVVVPALDEVPRPPRSAAPMGSLPPGPPVPTGQVVASARGGVPRPPRSAGRESPLPSGVTGHTTSVVAAAGDEVARLPGATGPRVSVVVPARDEAERLPRLLDGLAASMPPPDEVVVVDDGSSDGTAEVARRRGARVVTTEAPAGWTGKAHACALGASVAQGDVLVFVDADVSPTGSVVADLAAAAVDVGGIVSAHPVHRVERLYERLSAGPGLVALLGAGTGGPAVRRWWRGAFAFGPALAVPAEVYRRIGGHAAVRSSVVDDVALARRADAAGVPVAAYLGGPQLTYRMYPDGFGQLVEGWTKNLATGGRTTPPLRLAAVVVWVTAALQAALGVAGVGEGTFIAACAVYVLFAVQFHVLLRRIGDFGLATAALFPLVLVAFLGLFARSVVLTLGPGRVRWRGRVVSVGRSR